MTVTLLYYDHKTGQQKSMVLTSACNTPLLEIKGIKSKDLKHLVDVQTVDQLIAYREMFLKNKSLSVRLINFINTIQKKFTVTEKQVSVKITDPDISSKVIGQIMSPFLEKNKTEMGSDSKRNISRKNYLKKNRSYSIRAFR